MYIVLFEQAILPVHAHSRHSFKSFRWVQWYDNGVKDLGLKCFPRSMQFWTIETIGNTFQAKVRLWIHSLESTEIYATTSICGCVCVRAVEIKTSIVNRAIKKTQKKLDRNQITLTFARDEHSWYTKYSQWVKCAQAKNASSIPYARWMMQSLIQIHFFALSRVQSQQKLFAYAKMLQWKHWLFE